jgi:hypothetical protein
MIYFIHLLLHYKNDSWKTTSFWCFLIKKKNHLIQEYTIFLSFITKIKVNGWFIALHSVLKFFLHPKIKLFEGRLLSWIFAISSSYAQTISQSFTSLTFNKCLFHALYSKVRKCMDVLLFIYSHVHTLFGSFLYPAPLPHPFPSPLLSFRQVWFCTCDW